MRCSRDRVRSRVVVGVCRARAAGARSHAAAAAGPPPGAASCRRSRSGSCRTACRSGSSSCTRCRSRRSTSSCCSGSADDPAGKFGVASLTPAMLERRRGHRGRRSRSPTRSTSSAPTSAPAAASTRRPCGCTCRSRGSPTRCRSWPTSRCGRRFPTDELERLRQQRLTEPPPGARRPGRRSRRWRSRACSTARRTATARRRRAPPKTIKAFTADDLRAFYAAAFRPDNATLLVVGDVTPDTRAAAARVELRRVEGARRGAGARVTLPAGAAAGARDDLSRRQAGRAAVADPHRLDRRAALDARLLSDSGDEHDPRRLVHARA